MSLGKGRWLCDKVDAPPVRLPPMGLHLELSLHPAEQGQKEVTVPQHLPHTPATVPEKEFKRASHSSDKAL